MGVSLSVGLNPQLYLKTDGRAFLEMAVLGTGAALEHADRRGYLFKGLQLFAMDGITLRTHDTVENCKHFGARNYVGDTVASYPQVRDVTFTCLPTHMGIAPCSTLRHQRHRVPLHHSSQIEHQRCPNTMKVTQSFACASRPKLIQFELHGAAVTRSCGNLPASMKHLRERLVSLLKDERPDRKYDRAVRH
jgi:hypothetical protein